MKARSPEALHPDRRDGRPYSSERPGTLGGHRKLKGYGRLDCLSALRWIAKGHYVRHRVFFALRWLVDHGVRVGVFHPILLGHEVGRF
jgi:hypothetical protein